MENVCLVCGRRIEPQYSQCYNCYSSYGILRCDKCKLLNTAQCDVSFEFSPPSHCGPCEKFEINKEIFKYPKMPKKPEAKSAPGKKSSKKKDDSEEKSTIDGWM